MAIREHLEVLKQGVKVWNKWGEAPPNVLPVLPILSGADFSGADFGWAILMGANLMGANLMGANLMGANLMGADLMGANLSRANLFEARLSGTRLTYTTLSSASVTQADFTKAVLNGTQFSNIDLSKAIGLETVDHEGPSTIGVDTIVKSKGQIPEVFLRGAGIPDDVIEFVRTLQGKPIQFYSGFISYNHEDYIFARRLYDALQGRGIRCWLDKHELRPGDPLHESVNQAIRMRDKLILCCSKTSLNSWWVDIEVKAAFEEERRRSKEQGKPVSVLLPLNLDGYIFSEDCTYELSAAIKTRLVGDFVGWEHDNNKFEVQFEQVVDAMQTGRASY